MRAWANYYSDSAAYVQGMPAVVNTFRAGLTIKSEFGLNVLLDYVGMEIDGEFQHGAIAKIQTRF